MILLFLLDHGEYRKAIWFGKENQPIYLEFHLLFDLLFTLGCLASPISSQAFPMHIISAVNPLYQRGDSAHKIYCVPSKAQKGFYSGFLHIFGRKISDLSFLYRWLFITATNTFRKVLPKHLCGKNEILVQVYILLFFRLMGS